MDTGKIVVGVLAGVAVGALLGVLFAPEKGSVIRTKISEKGDDYVDDLKDKFNEFLDGVKKDIEVVKGKANEFVGNGLAKVDEHKVK
jgi:gas vesicle protein